MNNINFVFVGYYNLISKKWKPRQALDYIFKENLYGCRYYECCLWNRKWKKSFTTNGLPSNQVVLKQFFDYQIFRFRKSKYPPSVSSLFSNASISKFKLLYSKPYFEWLIKKKKYQDSLYKNIVEIGDETEDGNYDINYDSSINIYIKKNGNMKKIYDYCCSVDIFYNKKSKYCPTCVHKNRCMARDS